MYNKVKWHVTAWISLFYCLLCWSDNSQCIKEGFLAAERIFLDKRSTKAIKKFRIGAIFRVGRETGNKWYFYALMKSNSRTFSEYHTTVPRTHCHWRKTQKGCNKTPSDYQNGRETSVALDTVWYPPICIDRDNSSMFSNVTAIKYCYQDGRQFYFIFDNLI